MPFTEEGKAVMLYAVASNISHASLHSGPPPGRELRGGGYRRLPIDFRDPLTGEISSNRELIFEVPEGSYITHVGFWTTVIGGTLIGWGKAKEKQFRGRGVYVVDAATLEILDIQ